MDKFKIFKIIVTTLFLVYLFLFFASESGYYEYNVRKQTVLTSEKIKEFEQDVKENKNVDLNKYLESTKKEYKNNLTNTCTNISTKVNYYFKTGVESVFKIINKLVED